MTLKKRLAYLAVGTLTIAGMSGALGSAAYAADDPELPTSGSEYTALVQSLFTTDSAVQAVATDASGNVVVYTTAPAESGLKSLVGSKSNVVVKTLSAPLEAYDTDDVVGGAGYAAFDTPVPAGTVSSCSVGFSGFTPDGDPAVISAGHCTHDNANKYSALTLPTGDPAGGGGPDGPITLTSELGLLGFSQYGGPGNSAGAEGDVDSVDISTIDITNESLNLLPEVTDWTTAESEDLSESTLPVRSVGEATVGGSVSKSGRTTGFSTGTVESVKGWANVGGRQVYGFMSVLESMPGDSGGSMIQGDTAVGVVSGGGETTSGESLVWGADLEAGLALTGGYTVEVKVDAPALTSPADGGDVFAGGTISGTGPAGTTLVVNPSEGAKFEVAIGADGTWSFPAPGQAGAISYSALAKSGFSTSPATTFGVTVLPAPLAAPVFSSPADGKSVTTKVSAISGTGEPGATVTLTGAVEGTALVGSDGTWSVEAALGYGRYSVTATQVRDDASQSEPATTSFAVVPVAPVIGDPKTGLGYDQGSGPTSVSGTGVKGAVVSLTVNGSAAGTATVKNGVWSIALVGQLAPGTVTLVATQSIDGVTSAGTTSTITITAVNNGGGNGGGGTGGGSVPAGNPGSGSLANTGAPVTTLLGGGVALLLAAGGLLLVSRRLKTARQSD